MLKGIGIRQKKERRLTEQLILHWQLLRKGRAFPSYKEIEPTCEELIGIWQDCFVVKIGKDDSGKIKHEYIYLGLRIKEKFGGDLSADIAMPLADKFASQYREVCEDKQPLVDEDEFTNIKGEVIKYRKILLPLGEDGEYVEYILGGMRCKIFDEAQAFGNQ